LNSSSGEASNVLSLQFIKSGKQRETADKQLVLKSVEKIEIRSVV